jgi:Protein of unknown function (DUF1203)
MTYRITGLARKEFEHFFAMDAAELAEHSAMRVTAKSDRGFPCRVSLQDAKAGEDLILLNYVSHDVATPYRSAYAIYVREHAEDIAPLVDTVPAVFTGRPIALRAFDADGMLRDAALALPGEANDKIHMLFANAQIAYLHAHNAAHGCFSARVDRD